MPERLPKPIPHPRKLGPCAIAVLDELQLRGVTHHLIDVCEADEFIDAAGYARRADAAIADVAARGKLPIVVGGTGLWLRSLMRGLVALPQVDRALRARIEAEWDAAGGEAMHDRLSRVDPLSAARIHKNDKLRVVRALAAGTPGR